MIVAHSLNEKRLRVFPGLARANAATGLWHEHDVRDGHDVIWNECPRLVYEMPSKDSSATRQFGAA